MGGVNSSPDYLRTMGIGLFPSGVVTDEIHQGGIVSIYYFGAIVGCFIGGWFADRIGRINGVVVGAAFAVVGGALQAASTSSDFILVARVITGLGTGALIAIVPVYIAEVSTKEHRGSFLGYVFIANYLGISTAYWINFGLQFMDGGLSPFRWKFLLGFQCVPVLIVLLGIKLLPDSPRYLVSAARFDEAQEVLEHLRGGASDLVNAEMTEMIEASKGTSPSSPTEFVKILLGRANNPSHAHLGRRAWLCVWLQIVSRFCFD
jgi:MFS family permease